MKKYEVRHSSKFKRMYRQMAKRGYNMALLDAIVNTLASKIPLHPKHRDHALVGNWKGFRECHITPDWLLIYKIKANVLTLVLQETGTHSDLFKK